MWCLRNILVLLTAAIVGCGGDDDAGPRSVEEFLDRSPQQAVEVEGFLLIDGDPTQDIRLLMDSDNIDLIMKDGVIYKDEL